MAVPSNNSNALNTNQRGFNDLNALEQLLAAAMQNLAQEINFDNADNQWLLKLFCKIFGYDDTGSFLLDRPHETDLNKQNYAVYRFDTALELFNEMGVEVTNESRAQKQQDTPSVTESFGAASNGNVIEEKGPVADHTSLIEDALLEVIASHESGGDYNIAYGGRRANFTEMTIDEVLQWQADNNPPGLGTAAAGKYQIIRGTLRDLKEKMDLSGDELFDEAMQDKMAVTLMNRRGFEEFLNGQLSTEAFMRNLSKEWASLPKDMDGSSYYAGDGINKAHTKPEDVVAALDETRSRFNNEFSVASLGEQDAPQPAATTEQRPAVNTPGLG
jgi:muramidase (phage lysozyme)